MAQLTQIMVNFCIEAYNALKDDKSENACYIKYRNNDEKYIAFIMQKQSWYFGKWVVFDNGTQAMTIDEPLLIKWSEEVIK